jgi:hypothetical protein
MGSNVTPNDLRGFLIPSKSFTLGSVWDAQSSYTQKNPRAGIPEAQQLGTNMQLKTIGEQAQDITVTTQQGGVAGVNARYTWTDASANEFGRDWKNILTQWDYLRYSSSAAVNNYVHTDVVESVNGTIYFVTESITSGNRHYIIVSKKERGGAVTTLATLYNSIVASTNTTAHPAIELMQDGSLIVAYFNYTTATETNITVHRSYDGGSNWQRITTRGLIDNIDIDPSTGYTIKDMRFARNHSLTLWVELVLNTGTAKNRVAQYRSGNSALAFRLVGQISTTGEGHFAGIRPVVFPDGDIGCVFLDAADGLKFRRIPNSSIRLTSSDWASQEVIIYSGGPNWGNLVSNDIQDSDLAIWYQDARCFVFAREYNTGKIYGFVSDDKGDTWNAIAGGYIPVIGDGLVYDPGAASMEFDHMVATPFEGRTAILAHANNSLHILYFGGYSTIGYPSLVENPKDFQYSRWETTWNPTATPDTSSKWTTAGAGTHSITTNGLDIQTTSAQIRSYSYGGSFPADFTEAWMMRFRVQVVTGNGTTVNRIALLVTQDDTTNSRMLNIRFTGSSFIIRDNASTLTTVTWDMTIDTEFVINWLGDTAKVSYRHVGTSHAKDWTTYTASIGTYATGAGNTLQWGHLALPTITTQSYWREFYVSTGAPTGDQIDIDKAPTSYPEFGEYTYVDGGLRITTVSSPARGEDAYLIEPRYDNPIDNMFPEVALSPRLSWRSTDDTAQQNIAWYIDPVVAATSKNYNLNSVIGLYLGNINWRTGTLQKWDGVGWITMMSIDTSTGLTSTFERAGHAIQCDTTGTDFYLHNNEARGWRAELTNGGVDYLVYIKQSTEGVWGKNTDTKRAILMIDTSKTDPSTLPTSGSIKLIPDSVCLVIQTEDDATGGEFAYRLQIDVQDTVEGYFQIGSMVQGHVMMTAPQYQRGRTISYEPNIQEQETLDGMYYARKMSNGRRSISIAWTEPVDTTKLYTKDPNYWQLSSLLGAHPIANMGDSPLNMMGAAKELSGVSPLVYLPVIAKDTNTQLLNRMMDHLYCRISGGVSIESVLGSEEDNELFRVASVSLVEIE